MIVGRHFARDSSTQTAEFLLPASTDRASGQGRGWGQGCVVGGFLDVGGQRRVYLWVGVKGWGWFEFRGFGFGLGLGGRICLLPRFQLCEIQLPQGIYYGSVECKALQRQQHV
jgi:hypothetical protein